MPHAFRFLPPREPDVIHLGHVKRLDPVEEQLNRALWDGVRDSPYAPAPVMHDKKSKVITYKIPHRAKRAGFDPLIGFPNCLKCAGKAEFNGELNVGTDLTYQKLMNEIKPGGRNGQCLFYGQRELKSKPASLSGVASDLACDWAKTKPKNGETTRAIWDMWPKDEERSCEKKTDTTGYDYYCLNAWDPKCCWLNPVWGDLGADIKDVAPREAKTRPYFQQMSQAMAETCTGDVYVVHEYPNQLGRYQPVGQNPSIWLSHELPALRRAKNRGVMGDVWVVPIVYSLDNISPALTPSYDRSTWVKRTDVLVAGAAKRHVEDNELMAIHWKKVREGLRAEKLKQAAQPFDNSTQVLEARWGTCKNSAAAREAKEADYFG
ncbi:NPP1 domain-containing [Pyrenophora seminiperda CCB06]|uniref:NPP1 domain-containing n=1 Tax=Pyrenophora seminiperda CCB06 TaxID=1302712 RepID=A0A3M7MD29_9PLEO|nr:NPP1 domain-containing [Pyrenophora seminiperda CCB06]